MNFPFVQFSLSPILGSVSTFKTFVCGDLSALKKPEMRIFHWFSFPNFPLVQLSSSPFLGSISMFKTFMNGHLCVVTLSALRIQRCEFSVDSVFLNFPLVQFSPSPILGSISTFKIFMHGHLCVVTFLPFEYGDANFPLIQFSKLSIGSVFPVTHPRLKHLCMDIDVW